MTRGEELWVAACIKAALPGMEVRAHDDGSSNVVHELDLIRNGSSAGAQSAIRTAGGGDASTKR
ncbi:hypothetical protein [Cellulosimicrobium sp. CpK407]|uniref:hypothetical protein n=1 Tax=Cellulosimicrobium sp. CpK407 TaxID=3229847 RepID=UPI003F337101